MNGEFLAVVAAVFVGFGTIVGAQAAKLMNPVLLASLALLLSALLLRALASLLKEEFQAKQLARNAGSVLQVALLRSVLGNALLALGFGLTTGVKSVFLFGLEPAFVTIAGASLFKEKVTVQQVCLIALLFFGAFLLSTGGDLSAFAAPQTGDALVAGALAFFALSYFPSRKAMKTMNSTSFTTTVNAVGGALLLPIAFIFFNAAVEPAAANWQFIIAYTLLFSVFSLYFFFSALKAIKPWVVSSLLQLAPLPGAALAFLWLGEVLNGIQIIGALIILASSYVIARQLR